MSMPVHKSSAIADLFKRLHAAEIAACHWKSNEHLGPALVGETDLDLLVDAGRIDDVRRILQDLDGRRFQSVAAREHSHIEDWFLMDPATDRLLHVHLHERLVVGGRGQKAIRLPWERRVLDSRIVDEASQVPIAAPDIEMLMLLVRAAIKLTLRDHVALLIGRAYRDAHTQREYDWLRHRASDEQVLTLARELLGTMATGSLRTLLGLGISRKRLFDLRDALTPKLNDWRIHSPWRRRRRQWQSAMLSIHRRCGRPVALRRRLQQNGIVIAIVGIDGAGKSTLTAALRQWLRCGVDNELIYFGSGDGPASLTRRMLDHMRAMLLRKCHEPASGDAGADIDAPPSRLSRMYGAINGVLIARERKVNLHRCATAKRHGLVVLTDRYPQLHAGAMDGPRIINGPAWAMRYERRVYEHATANPPNVLLRLRINPELAHQRKPELDVQILSRRAEAVEDYAFGETTRIIDVAASQPLDDVLHQTKVAIWEQLPQ
jgi:hypothetical protein